MSPAQSASQASTSAGAKAFESVVGSIKAGRLPEARQSAMAALAAGHEHPLFLNLRALDHEDAGRFEEALKDLRRAHFLAPKDYGVLNACGIALLRLNRYDEALQCFDQVTALAPQFGPAWFNRASALERLGEKVKAEASYTNAVELNPENPSAWANLAFLAIQRGDPAAARAHADRALSLEPRQTTALLVLAEVERGDPPTAERRLRDLLSGELGPFDRAMALSQLGDVLDAQGRFSDAFRAYEEGNACYQAESRARFEIPGQTIPDSISFLRTWAAALGPRTARAASPATAAAMPARGHVFLIGFPRSGTTLIESALTAHPDVVSLEERNTLYAGIVDFLTGLSGLEKLERLSDSALDRYRIDYWSRVEQFGVAVPGHIFIDKNPFNTLKWPLIQRLFPDAKVIFSIRDPRDVVLSCFRRRFDLNPSTYEFLDLQRAADNYVSTMELAEVFRANLPMAEHALVYERLVEDFPGEARAVCDFIGADWREDLIDFSARARRGDVASASSQQIARGLFSDGAGQWRRYKAQLEPVLQKLAPWVERFGYPAD